MGTRSNTVVIETGWNKPERVLVNMYRQFDGYFSVYGNELCNFLERTILCNGIGGHAPEGKFWSNGAGCFAAWLISTFKEEAGGIYINNPDSYGSNDYTYIIRVDSSKPGKGFDIEVLSYGKKVFQGNLAEFRALIDKPYDEDDE